MSFPTFVDWGAFFPVDTADSAAPPAEIDLATSATLAVGDLLVVTLGMWMASGGTPTLKLGHWPGGGGFIDESSDWTALTPITNGHAYMRAYWRKADTAIVAAAHTPVIGQLSGHDWTTDGGTVWLTVFRGTGTPTLVYQDTTSGPTTDTPPQDPGDPILHTYFGRNAYTAPAAVPVIEPFGLSGQSSGYPSLQTAAVDDNQATTDVDSTSTDQYGAGYFYPRGGSLPETYDGQITWDTSTGDGVRAALGAQTAVIQGLRIPPPTAGFMAIV